MKLKDIPHSYILERLVNLETKYRKPYV